MTVGVFLPYVPLGTSQSRPRSGTNGLQEAGLQGRICSFLLSFIYSDALSLYRLRFSVERELISPRPPLDEPCGEQNLSLADIVSDTRPDPEEAHGKRQIAKRLVHATSRMSSTCDKPVG